MLALVVLAASGTTACTGDDAGEVVTVAAASSLTDAFTAIAEGFEQEHPGVEVRLSFGSSTTLADQVLEGASIDVLATADEEAMALVVDEGLLAEEPATFAGNDLVIVTRAGADSPLDGGLDGLGDVDVVAMCASSAPCGRIADARLADRFAAGTLAEDRITRAPNARATLTALLEGDADAAVVYATDARSAGDAVAVHTLGSDDGQPDARYPIAALADATDPDLAAAFVAAVRGEDGRAALAAAGFATDEDVTGS